MTAPATGPRRPAPSAPLATAAAGLALLGSCTFRTDRPPPVDHPPSISAADSWWSCDWDPAWGDYWFEFETYVSDDDGATDVVEVRAAVYFADTDRWIDDVWLGWDGGGWWYGTVWERTTNLLCGEPMDVIFEAWDAAGAYDSLTVWYY